MAHTLNIIKGGKTLNSFIVGRKQYATVPVKGGTQFQIIDEQGKLVSHPKVKMHGKDLWVFLEEGGTQPDIILENYAAFKPVDTALANKQNATFATTNAAATLAPQVSSSEGRNATFAKEVNGNADATHKMSSNKLAQRKAMAHKTASPAKQYEDKSDTSDNYSHRDYDGDSVGYMPEGWVAYAPLGAIALAGVAAFAISKYEHNKDKDDEGQTDTLSRVADDNVVATVDADDKTVSADTNITAAPSEKNLSEGSNTKASPTYTIEATRQEVDEVQHGTSGSDTLAGTKQDDAMYGYKGADTLSGGKGNDMLFGNEGDDKLMGGEGNDTLKGGDGNDTLIGGTGADILTGGKGHDIFVFDVLDGQTDIIADFGAGDKIALSDVFTSIKDKSDIAEHLSLKDGQLMYDEDGSGANAPVAIASFNNHLEYFEIAQDVTII